MNGLVIVTRPFLFGGGRNEHSRYKNFPYRLKKVPYGHDLDVVVRNVEAVMATGKVAAFATFCFDFDHYERDSSITNESLRTIAEAALKAWEKIPGA